MVLCHTRRTHARIWNQIQSVNKSLPDQEGNNLMFMSELREVPSAPCLAVALLEDPWAQTALRLSEMVGYTGVLISP